MIRIQSAKDAHLDQIVQLIAPFVEAKLLLPRDRSEIHRLIKRGFVALHARQVIGFCSVEIYSKKLAEIHCLAVREEFQKQGIGKRLVKRCIELAKAESILELMAISASDHFLKECGFDYSLPNQKRALFYRFDE